MEEKKSDIKIEEFGISRITDEKTQIAIRIPAELKDLFRINTKTDGFKWVILRSEDEISLRGSLIKEAFKNEEKNRK